MDARIQGLWILFDAWAVAWVDPAELRRHAQGIYLADDADLWDDAWDGNFYRVDEERTAEVKSKVRNMVVKKNSK